MAEIRDELILDVSQALASIREVENALNRALAQVVVDIETGPGLGQLDAEIAAATDEAQQLAFSLDAADDAANDLQSEMRGVEKATDKAADETERLSKETKQAKGFAGELRDSFTRGFDLKSGIVGAVAALGAREVVQGIRSAVDAASDLAESTNAVNVIFEEASETVLAFGADTSDAVFLAAAEFNQLAASTGNLLKGFGLDVQTAADLTIQLTERAADLASVFNTDVDEALNAINAALRGESEQIRRFTGSFSADEVKAYGRELFGVTGALTDQQQALAAVEFILQKTQAVQGDAANTAGEFANQQRALSEAWTNASAVIGQQLIPVLTDLLPLLVNLAGVVPTLVKGAQDLFTITDGLVGTAGNLGQALFEVAQGDFGGAADQFNDAKDAAFRFADTLFGSRSILRDFQQLLADGEDNVTDYANALQTVADEGDLIRLFEEITQTAASAGVGIEAQASALRTLVTEGRLTEQQTRFVKDRFIELAQELGRTDLIGEGTIFTFSPLTQVFEATTNALAGLRDEANKLTPIELNDQFQEQLLGINDVAPETASSVELVNQAIEDSLAAFEAEQAALAELPQVIRDVGAAAGDSNDDIFDLGESWTEAADAADRFRTITLELTDPVFAAAAAQERLTAATEKEAQVLADSEATAQDRANATLGVASAAAEADAALRGLGNINLVGGNFDRSVSVIAELLGTTREEVLGLLEDAEILDNTAIGPQVTFLVDDEDLEASLEGIPDSVSVAVRYETAGLPPSLSPAQVDQLDPRVGGGVALSEVNLTINNPVDNDIAGNAALAANTVGTIIGGTSSFRGRR